MTACKTNVAATEMVAVITIIMRGIQQLKAVVAGS
jgi:hypothetical protein